MALRVLRLRNRLVGWKAGNKPGYYYQAFFVAMIILLCWCEREINDLKKCTRSFHSYYSIACSVLTPTLIPSQRAHSETCWVNNPVSCRYRTWFGIIVLFILCSPFVLNAAQRGENPRVSGLVEIYGLSSSIVYGEEDSFAANLLLDFLKPHLKSMKAVPVKGDKPRKDDLVIYVGSFKSNPMSREAFQSLGYHFNWEALPEGSFLLKTFRKAGRTTIFVTGKDSTGTLYAANDLKTYYLHLDLGRDFLNELQLVERAQLKYRWVRNWDSLPDWNMTHASRADKSLDNPDTRMSDLKGTIDFMSEHRLNGLISGRFPQDLSGGIAAAQEICRYAMERGVRILPRITLAKHRGFFYAGDDKFNIAAWTKAHPELRAVDRQGGFRDFTLCPEKPENRAWLREGLQWLYQNFKIGGISLELGDLFVCFSEDCKTARSSMGGNDPDYYKDMARIVKFVAEEAHQLDPNSWISYFTGTGFDFDSVKDLVSAPASSAESVVSPSFPPEFIKTIPEYAICQWDLTSMVKNKAWPSPFKASAKHNVGVLRFGGVSAGSKNELYFKRIEEITHHAISSNLEGLGIDGEASLEQPSPELGYLAFSALSFNPAADMNEFFRFKVSRLYGGEAPAKKLLQILDLLEDEKGITLNNLPEALRLATDGLGLANRDGKERWTRLIHYLEKVRDNRQSRGRFPYHLATRFFSPT